MFFALALLRKTVLLFVILGISNALALGVMPTKLILSPKQPIASLSLSNDSKTPVLVQLKLLKWQQQGGEDIYTPSYEVIVTPPLFTIPAGSTQIVRLGFEKPLFGEYEKTYRLYVDEVVSKANIKPGQLKMALRLSLPVVVEASVPVREAIHWVAKSKGKKIELSAHNKGNNLVFINALQGLSAGKSALTSRETTFAYLLPGSRRTWLLSTTKPGKLALIEATVNDKILLAHVN